MSAINYFMLFELSVISYDFIFLENQRDQLSGRSGALVIVLPSVKQITVSSLFTIAPGIGAV